MPLDRAALERVLAQVNQRRRPEQKVRVEDFGEKSFTLAFADRPMPEGQCLDEDFVEIQFALHMQEKVDAGIVGARFDEDLNEYRVEYEVVEWD